MQTLIFPALIALILIAAIVCYSFMADRTKTTIKKTVKKLSKNDIGGFGIRYLDTQATKLLLCRLNGKLRLNNISHSNGK
jgi:hypothetical protein